MRFLRVVHDFEKLVTRHGLVMGHACDVRFFSSATFENAMTNVWHARNFGESNDVSIVDMEGVHGQCLLTSKEPTSKVKTSSDARLASYPRTPWIIHGLGGFR